MKSLAEILGDGNCRLTGSDAQTDSATLRILRERKLRIDCGHREHFVPRNVDALIYSPAIPPDNPERRQAAERGIPQFSLPEVLGRLMEQLTGISVAGTHGKSTTTALMAWILREAGRSPSAFIGATMRQLNRGGWAGDGDGFVVESCEYQRNFLHLEPQHAVVLEIEPDHFETYPHDAALLNGFSEFLRRIKPGGTLLLCGDCPRSIDAAREAGVEFTTFGGTPQSHWWFSNVKRTEKGTRFRVMQGDAEVADVDMPLFGQHNVQNALAAVAFCSGFGLPAATISNAVRRFPGIKRRLELFGEWRGMPLIDDYAHHPTAVRVTLQTVREMYPHRRLWCVFQPHQAARVQRMRRQFAAALSLADDVLVTPVYSAREQPGEQDAQCARHLVGHIRQIQHKEKACRFCPSLDRILPTLEDEARPADVVVLMGAGDIERIRHELARRIFRHHTYE